MTVLELKVLLNQYPNNLPVVLVDLSTDDIDDGNYLINKENFVIEKVVDPEGNDAGEALVITFINKLNPNPLKN